MDNKTRPLTLRPYQEEALRISKQQWDAGVTRQLLALPTGTGKTCIFASLPDHHQIQGKMLVLVHRDELAKQARDKILGWNSGLREKDVGIEMGDRPPCTGWEKVVIAGVQTVGQANSERLRKFPRSLFDVIVCDEAHHSTAATYKRVFQHFGLFDEGNRKLLLGVTATPFRNDREALQKIYKEIIYKMTILDAILQGWITDIRGFHIRTTSTGTNLDSVDTRYDDFVVSQLSIAINTEARNALVVRDWKYHAENRQTIVFTADISHAQRMAQMFKSFGVPAEALWGGDPDRVDKLEDHKAGRLKVLCNCAVLTEGYDDWRVGCIVMARPTQSRLLFVQTIGRGLRIQDDIDNLHEAQERNIPILKKDCLVLDFVDNTLKHHLVDFLEVFGVQLSNGSSLKEAVSRGSSSRNADGEIPLVEPPNIDGIETSADEVDFFKGRKPNPFWKRQKSGSYYLWLKPNGWIRVTEESSDRWHIECDSGEKVAYEGGACKLDVALILAEKWASSHGWSPTESPKSRILCPKCKKPIFEDNLPEHKTHCRPPVRRVKVACPYCEIKIWQANLYNHMTARCRQRPNRPPVPRKRVRCPLCKQKVKKNNLEKHLTAQCPLRPNRPQPNQSKSPPF